MPFRPVLVVFSLFVSSSCAANSAAEALCCVDSRRIAASCSLLKSSRRPAPFKPRCRRPWWINSARQYPQAAPWLLLASLSRGCFSKPQHLHSVHFCHSFFNTLPPLKACRKGFSAGVHSKHGCAPALQGVAGVSSQITSFTGKKPGKKKPHQFGKNLAKRQETRAKQLWQLQLPPEHEAARLPRVVY